jgi:hypothetical protein
MDSSVSAKEEIWFLRVCHHVSNAVYQRPSQWADFLEIGVGDITENLSKDTNFMEI